MNHAFSSPRNELERSAVARPVRQINNVICSPGSRPIRSGPKDFVRMVCMYGRTSVAVPHFPQIERTEGKGEDPFSLLSLSLFVPLLLSPPFHSLPLFSDNRTCQRQRWCLNKGAKWREIDVLLSLSVQNAMRVYMNRSIDGVRRWMG